MKLDKIIAVRTAKTIYRDADKVIKLFNSDYSKADILNEALNQARVEATDLAIPRILEVTKVQDKWAIVTEFIEGKTLAQLLRDEPEKSAEYLDFFVELQMQVHSKRVALLNKLKDKMHRKISETTLDATTRYDLHTRLEGMQEHQSVCHGDFNPSNIIIAPDKTPYIIDWAHVTQGNAGADVARSYLLFWLQGDFDTADKYLDLYCKKSDTAKQTIQQWMPIVAASQSVKGKEKEREFLLSWVNVVDFY
ncbi:MAG: phosphotransferase [Bradymonadales bacterium]|jgi:thiamine kinase-like enzyme